MTINTSGAFNIVTTAALSSTTFTYSVTAPVRTVTSPAFSVVVFNCLPLTSVIDITAVHQVQLGYDFTIDFVTTTSSTDCVVDPTTYLVSSAKTGMGLQSNGTYSVDALAAYSANVGANVSVVEVQHQFTVAVGT